jgi:hypothetical protein
MENESRVRSQPLSEHYGDATSTCSGLLKPCEEDRPSQKGPSIRLPASKILRKIVLFVTPRNNRLSIGIEVGCGRKLHPPKVRRLFAADCFNGYQRHIR